MHVSELINEIYTKIAIQIEFRDLRSWLRAPICLRFNESFRMERWTHAHQMINSGMKCMKNSVNKHTSKKKIEQHIVRTEWNADRSSLDIPTHTWRRNLDLAFTSRSDRKAWFITILLVLVGFFCVVCRVGVTAVYFRSIGGFLLLCMPNSLIFHTLRLVKFCCLCNASHFLKNLRCLISQSKHKVRCEVKICSIWFIRAHIILNQLWRCRSQKLFFFLAAKKFPRKKQRRHLIVWHRTVSSANRPFLFEQEWTFALIAIDKPSALWCFFYFTYRRVTSTEIR